VPARANARRVGDSMLQHDTVAPLGRMSETFGERLRRLREAQGLSVPEIASAVGASEGTIRQLETGNVKNPAFALGLRLADKLNVDPYYLALGTGFSMQERFELLERRVGALEQRR
jgi:transcriptional regulator with XRE-family HTH domain